MRFMFGKDSILATESLLSNRGVVAKVEDFSNGVNGWKGYSRGVVSTENDKLYISATNVYLGMTKTYDVDGDFSFSFKYTVVTGALTWFQIRVYDADTGRIITRQFTIIQQAIRLM